MTIVHVLPLIYAGGPSVVVRDMLIELKKNNPKSRIELWVSSKVKNSKFKNNKKSLEFEKNIEKELETEGVSVYYSKKKYSKDILTYWSFLIKHLKRLNPDIIHFHSETGIFISLPILFFNRTKVFQTMHSEKILNPKLQKYIISPFTNKFIVVSEAVSHNLFKIGVKKSKIVIVNNGINLKKFEHNRIIAKQVKKFIAVGRLTEAKNYKMMVSSFMLLIEYLKKKGITDLPVLNIIGDGEDRKEIEDFISERDASNYIFLLGIRNDINEYLKESDVLLMSSLWEGLPIILIEAAASGLPIITTDVGGNKLIVEESTGRLVESNNYIAFSEALIDLYDNYILRKTMSENIIEKANEFKIENMVNKIEIIYRQLI